MLTRDSTELTDPQVVPSLADRWSHHTGGTHIKVAPCHCRATTPSTLGGAGGSKRLVLAPIIGSSRKVGV